MKVLNIISAIALSGLLFTGCEQEEISEVEEVSSPAVNKVSQKSSKAEGTCGAQCFWGRCTIDCTSGTKANASCDCEWGCPKCHCGSFSTLPTQTSEERDNLLNFADYASNNFVPASEGIAVDSTLISMQNAIDAGSASDLNDAFQDYENLMLNLSDSNKVLTNNFFIAGGASPPF